MKQSYEEKIVPLIRIFGVICLLLGIVLFCFSSRALDEGLLESHEYLFGIGTEPASEVELRDFQIYYDFVKYEGKVSFRMTKTNLVEYVTLRLPKEVTISYFNWTAAAHKYNKGYLTYRNATDYITDTQYNEGMRNHLIFTVENLDKELKTYWTTLEFWFKGKIYPNAEFEVDSETEQVRPPPGDEDGAFFKYYTGEKYTCIVKDCVGNPKQDELKFGYRENKHVVATKKMDSGWKNVDHYTFYLNYNKEHNELYASLRKWSFILMPLGLFPTIEFIALFFYRRRGTSQLLLKQQKRVEKKVIKAKQGVRAKWLGLELVTRLFIVGFVLWIAIFSVQLIFGGFYVILGRVPLLKVIWAFIIALFLVASYYFVIYKALRKKQELSAGETMAVIAIISLIVTLVSLIVVLMPITK